MSTHLAWMRVGMVKDKQVDWCRAAQVSVVMGYSVGPTQYGRHLAAYDY